MTDHDKLVFAELLDEKLNPITTRLDVAMRQLERNQVTLFGEQGDNGLNGTSKTHTRQIDGLRKFQWKALGGVGAITVILAIIQIIKALHG